MLARANGMKENLNVHVDKRLDKFLPPFYSSYGPAERQKIWKKNFKFMFVRHPFERLVSAHRNKFIEIEQLARRNKQ